MSTRWWSSTEFAEFLSKLVPDSISRVEENACYLIPEKLVEAMMALRDDADSNFVHLTIFVQQIIGISLKLFIIYSPSKRIV